MNPISETNLKSIFSGPASMSLILFYIKNKTKVWEGTERQLGNKDKIYEWTYDFMKILGLVDYFDNETNQIHLSNIGNKIFDLVKNIDDDDIFYYGIISEGKLGEYKTKLKLKLGDKDFDLFKTLFISILLSLKGYILIENILKENEDIGKSDLYEKLAEKLGVAKATLSNRVPSMLQLAELFELFSIRNGKYSVNKNSNNLIKEPEPSYNTNNLSSKPQNMINNLTSQESLLLLSLLTKPFSILYGVSGTGKSRVVKELWKKMYPGKGENGNYLYEKYFKKEAVPPNWFDETEVLGRYNEIEKYKEGSFTKILEEAIKDIENNYVYLLDEMNLSHIEQYFAQYLSAVEDLDNGNAWINIGEVSNNMVIFKEKDNIFECKILLEDKKILNDKNDYNNDLLIDINSKIDFKNKIFITGILKVNGKDVVPKIPNSSNPSKHSPFFQNFNKEIFKYFIDNKSKQHISDEILEKSFKIKKLIKLKEETLKPYEKMKISGEEIIYDKNDENNNVSIDDFITLLQEKYNNGVIVELKSEGSGNINLYYYNGYYLRKESDLNKTLKNIIGMVRILGEDVLKGLEIILKNEKNGEELVIKAKNYNLENNNEKSDYNYIEENILNNRENEKIIYYYNESNELVGKSLKIPKNLFVVGTINLDETTKSISPKVVDRANIIEFNDLDNYLFLEDKGSYNLEFLENVKFDKNFVSLLNLRLTKEKWEENKTKWELNESNNKTIQKLYNFLKIFKLHFSYRTINEILSFIALGKEVLNGNNIKNLEEKLLDIAVMQKVLPKLNGVIDPSFKLSQSKCEKYLYYDFDESDECILSNQSEEIKKLLKEGILQKDNDFINTTIKLQRMQQFFDTYQNVNYFLS